MQFCNNYDQHQVLDKRSKSFSESDEKIEYFLLGSKIGYKASLAEVYALS